MTQETEAPLSNETGRIRWERSMMDAYGTPGLTLTSGEGCSVWDADGNRYLDLLGGIAVSVLGNAHPAVANAVAEQAARLTHVSNFYAHEPGLRLAEELLALAGMDGAGRVLFCNSGGEANETAFKIARRTGRGTIVATEQGFHGRTMGALALTGQPNKRAPFEPVPGGVVHVPYGDADALESTVDSDTAAIVVEPIQGEAGVVVPPADYLRAARRIATERGALLVVDEVQTGIGRTGSWFAHQQSGITPDVVTLAKGLGGGMPIGACIGAGSAGELITAGQHGTTFGGNPVCCAAALAVLDTIRERGLLEAARRRGKELGAGIEKLDHPLVREVRGAGLLLGVQLNEPVAAELVAAGRRAGYLLNAVRPDVLRLAPALVLGSDEVCRFLDDLPGLLDDVSSRREAEN